MSSWQDYLLLTVLCLIIQGFFSMIEMACVSFHKMRLQYYISQGSRRAKWINYLLNRPALLFGTTLIGVNAALQLGSECSRRFYDTLGLSPDWSPLTQIIAVLIFAEIAPMSAGRRYAEHVSLIGIPLLFLFSILLRPIIWLLDLLCRMVNRILGIPIAEGGQYLSRDDLQNLMEERQETIVSTPQVRDPDTIPSRIFTLKNKSARDLMIPLADVQMVSSLCTVSEMRALLSTHYTPFLPIYQRDPKHIVAIAYPRDLLRLADSKRIREHSRSPWFIIEETSILQILKQFRRNNQSIAIVLDSKGAAVGILTLDEIVDEIFGRRETPDSILQQVALDRTFPGETTIASFNAQFNLHLAYRDAETLEEILIKALGHTPAKGESIRIDQFELTVEETTLLGVKTVSIRTIL